MIKLERNAANTVVLTLNESGPAFPVDFTLHLTNCQSHTVYTVDISDVSLYPDRYNEFVVTLNTGSPVIVLPEGYYDYAVYDIGSPAKLLEVGKCLVGPDVVVKTEYANTQTNIVYEG